MKARRQPGRQPKPRSTKRPGKQRSMFDPFAVAIAPESERPAPAEKPDQPRPRSFGRAVAEDGSKTGRRPRGGGPSWRENNDSDAVHSRRRRQHGRAIGDVYQ